MKAIKFTIAGVLLIPVLLLADPVKVDKPVVCDTMENMITYITGKFEEKLIWMGDTSENNKSALFLNSQTGTWSFLTATSSSAVCLLESGVGFQMKTANFKSGKEI